MQHQKPAQISKVTKMKNYENELKKTLERCSLDETKGGRGKVLEMSGFKLKFDLFL